MYIRPGWCRLDVGLEYGQALTAILCFSALSGAWLRLASGFLGPGGKRVLAVLPAVVGNLVATKLFCRREDCVTLILAVFNMWLQSFKALAWALDRGPLADALLNGPQFVLVYMTPLTPKHGDVAAQSKKKGRLSEHSGGSGAMLKAWLTKQALIVGLTALQVAWPSMPGLLRSFVWSVGLYALLSGIMDGPGALLTGLLGMELSPHFDKPWMANSLASFWNKRWDLAAGNTLRTLVYDPVVEGRLVHDRKVVHATNNPWRQLAGTFASFLVSGLMHELMFWYITGTHTRGLWLAYFLAQPPLIAAERVALTALKRRGVLLPNPLRITLTVGTQVVLGHWLFWSPVAGEVAGQVVGNIEEGLRQAAGRLLAGR